jgi:hypothetical protein
VFGDTWQLYYKSPLMSPAFGEGIGCNSHRCSEQAESRELREKCLCGKGFLERGGHAGRGGVAGEIRGAFRGDEDDRDIGIAVRAEVAAYGEAVHIR